jgi:hypothetical protein
MEFYLCVWRCAASWKAAFLAELSRVCQDNDSPCLIRGDLNIIRKSSEKSKPNNTNPWSFVFNAIIDMLVLRELPLNGRKFTWANNALKS